MIVVHIFLLLFVSKYVESHVFNFNKYNDFKIALKELQNELTRTYESDEVEDIPKQLKKLIDMTKRFDNLFEYQEHAVNVIEDLYEEVIEEFFEEFSKVEYVVSETISKTVFRMKGMTSITDSSLTEYKRNNFTNYYYILNKKSRTALDMSSEDKNFIVHGWEKFEGNEHQLWKFVFEEDDDEEEGDRDGKENDFFYLVNKKLGKVLQFEEDRSHTNSRNRNKVVGGDMRKGDPTQLWEMINYDEKYYYIRNKKTKTVIDIHDGLNFNGNPVQSWELKEGNKNQLWKFVFGETVKNDERIEFREVILDKDNDEL